MNEEIERRVHFYPIKTTTKELKNMLNEYDDNTLIHVRIEATNGMPEFKCVESVTEMDTNICHPTLVIGITKVIDNQCRQLKAMLCIRK